METQNEKNVSEIKVKHLGGTVQNNTTLQTKSNKYRTPKNSKSLHSLGIFYFFEKETMQLPEIIQEIASIKERNRQKEAEKAWETSSTRKVLIIAITYVFMVFFMNMIGVKGVYVNAMVPTFGFFLSTLSVGFFRKKYIEKYLSDKK